MPQGSLLLHKPLALKQYTNVLFVQLVGYNDKPSKRASNSTYYQKILPHPRIVITAYTNAHSN